jgi:hypothetical protein
MSNYLVFFFRIRPFGYDVGSALFSDVGDRWLMIGGDKNAADFNQKPCYLGTPPPFWEVKKYTPKFKDNGEVDSLQGDVWLIASPHDDDNISFNTRTLTGQLPYKLGRPPN